MLLGCRFDFESIHTLVTRDTVQSGDFFGAQVEALPGASGCHSRYNLPTGSHLAQLFAFLILHLYFYVA